MTNLIDHDAAMVVLSGGQDSTTCLFWAKREFKTVHAVTFDYGQRHAIELESAVKVAEMAGVDSHEVVKLPDGILAGKSFLTDLDAPVEIFSDPAEMEDHNAFKENHLDSSFVPMRNQLFLTLAANRAYTKGAGAIVIGVTAADYAEFGEFSWPWLAGFIDGDGCIGAVNGGKPRLSISQKDPELLYRIKSWVKRQFPQAESSISVSDGIGELYFGTRTLRLIGGLIYGHLRTATRREQYEKFDLPRTSQEPMSDGWLTGFWEADGGAYSSMIPTRANKDRLTYRFEICFYQKDRAVLDEIKSYLGKGSIHQSKSGLYTMKVSDGVVDRKLVRRMRPHTNCLRSFEKLTKHYHKLGLLAGGFNPPYPDCTPDFIYLMNKCNVEALKQPDLVPPKIETPVMYLTKAESVHLADSLPGCMAALAYSHTAYDGQYPPTGKDHASLLRAQGFERAGVPDPLVVRAWKEGLMELPETENYSILRA